ncbi:hypothetical protein DPX16_0284 [Anabarilius grahami]|uniref:Uncharacterized protein n=1 Tax=Anabarilius grahami TaxID=495550 RepID=A0A3N0Z9D5_ANAGA|nr:hypothetical protein DPX16_0284 [Anabarilius grahami]
MVAGDSLRKRSEAGSSRAALEAAVCEGAGAAGIRRSQLVRCGASSTAGELIPGGEGFQLRKSARRRDVVAEGERSEILWRNARLYSHTPRPFWRALARCIAIGSCSSERDLSPYVVRVKYRKGTAVTIIKSVSISY